MSDQIITIRCRENGPLVVHGPVRVIDHRGNELVPPPGKELVALCRCGRSGNKPFCDGSHKGCGFVGDTPVTPPEARPVPGGGDRPRGDSPGASAVVSD